MKMKDINLYTTSQTSLLAHIVSKVNVYMCCGCNVSFFYALLVPMS